ncbi:MAG: DUF1566 domain-containing protein [Thermotogota bacterium]|nr:DUF1566 domain-containing protein [Thermotogota bacterium]
MNEKSKNIIGWIGVGITLIVSSLWSYWGAVENFHEGMYSTSVWENLFMFIFQYMLFPIIFVGLAISGLKWKWTGLFLHIGLALFSLYFFRGAHFTVIGLMIVIPLILLGLIYFFGMPKPKRWAYRLIVALPLIIVISVSIPLAIRNSKRINDGDFGLRIVEGNSITLAWAPRGPGWPDRGVSWNEAKEICSYLSEDGTKMLEEEQNIWRLPGVDEAVRSMMLHGENAGGVWDSVSEQAKYEKTPDKESPLWDVHSKVIYYWTADTAKDNENEAYIIVYHGGVYQRRKDSSPSYLSFRAVRHYSGKSMY